MANHQFPPLLDFLVQDEKKHASMLRSLDKVKRGLYPYA